MEMNTRLQVEHPVTEMVTGVDLVKLQLKVAAGEPLPFRQEQIHSQGHAIECRLNAESPEKGFRPSPGRVTRFRARADRACGSTATSTRLRVPPHYDSLVAKIIAHGGDRLEAIARCAAPWPRR